MLFELTVCSGLIVLIYGLSLFFIPNVFLGSYIYKKGVWERFLKETSLSYQVLDHLLKGLGLTWVSWAWTGYFMHLDTKYPYRYSRNNAVLWSLWCLLDHHIRRHGLYSPLADILNRLLVISMTCLWLLTWLMFTSS